MFLPRLTLRLVFEERLDVLPPGMMPEADIEPPGVGIGSVRVLIPAVVGDHRKIVAVGRVHHVMQCKGLAWSALVKESEHPARRLAHVEPRARFTIAERF